MMLDSLLDPLFRIPLLAGLLVTVVLSLVGCLLRLRDEWLAALGFAHLAGLSALLGLALHWPAVIAAPLGATWGALAKGLKQFRGNSVYAVMILLGWAGTLLLAANTQLGSVMGHAMIEGQLFFAGPLQLGAAISLLLLTALLLPWLMPRLLRARFLPQYETANRLPARRWHLGFDLLIAIAMAIGTSTLGLMAAFALVFLPAWSAFRLARHWRHCLWLALLLGITAFLLTFFVALALNQPFGPLLVVVLLLQTALTRALPPPD